MGLTFVLLMVANLLIELSVLMVVRGLWKDQPMGRLLLTCVTVNLVSYPLAYLCIEQDGLPYGATEALVFLTEGMLYCLTLDCQIKTAAQITTMTNTVSLLCSLLVTSGLAN